MTYVRQASEEELALEHRTYQHALMLNGIRSAAARGGRAAGRLSNRLEESSRRAALRARPCELCAGPVDCTNHNTKSCRSCRDEHRALARRGRSSRYYETIKPPRLEPRTCGHCRTTFAPSCSHARFCTQACSIKAKNASRDPVEVRRDQNARNRRKAEQAAPGKAILRRVKADLKDVQRLVKQHANDLAKQQRDRRPYCDRLKEFIANYKTSRGCQICGVAAPSYILDLHHIDPATKSFDPSRAKSFPKAASEFAKCVVLCAIHHRMVEAGDLPCPKEHH